MIEWLIGIIIYIIIGFIYGLTMLFLIASEDSNDPEGEFDSGGSKILLLLTCTVFWIILIPSTIIYRIYIKLKGGN